MVHCTICYVVDVFHYLLAQTSPFLYKFRLSFVLFLCQFKCSNVPLWYFVHYVNVVFIDFPWKFPQEINQLMILSVTLSNGVCFCIYGYITNNIITLFSVVVYVILFVLFVVFRVLIASTLEEHIVLQILSLVKYLSYDC